MIASVYKSLVVIAMQLALVCLLFLAEISDAQAGITINGVADKVRDNILAYMQLDDEACDAPDWRVRRLFKVAENEISEALEVVGYYHVKIEKKLELGEACWKADFNIATGGPVLLRSVSIKVDSGGEQDEKLADVVQKCALRSGDILQHANYDLCRRTLAERRKDWVTSMGNLSNAASMSILPSMQLILRCISKPVDAMSLAKRPSSRQCWTSPGRACCHRFTWTALRCGYHQADAA